MASSYEFGIPGGSLKNNNGFTTKDLAGAGLKGEVRTASVLRAIQNARPASQRFSVVHDFMAPTDKYKANVDHLVVAGNTVIIIDSKVWSPGKYVTLAGKTWVYRPRKTRSSKAKGFEHFLPADKKTIPMLVSVMGDYLGSKPLIIHPTMVVWSPREKDYPSLLFYRPGDGVEVISGRRSAHHLNAIIPRREADPVILSRVLKLLS
jgi:hypothetical protein